MLHSLGWKGLIALAAAQLIHAAPTQKVIGFDNNDMQKVHQELIDAEIIPTVMDDFQPAWGLFASWKSDKASLGNTVDPSDVQSSPSVHFELAKQSHLESDKFAGMTHVIALTDPDAPSRDDPKWSEFCHWIATGVPLEKNGVTSFKLDDVVEYKPPGPPPKTGKHRYVFLAFVPRNGTTDPLHLTKPEDRKHWGSDEEGYGVREWARENGLMPIAANFVYAQNDEQ